MVGFTVRLRTYEREALPQFELGQSFQSPVLKYFLLVLVLWMFTNCRTTLYWHPKQKV